MGKREESDGKKCPYCAEDIHVEALKCKHCKAWISPVGGVNCRQQGPITLVHVVILAAVVGCVVAVLNSFRDPDPPPISARDVAAFMLGKCLGENSDTIALLTFDRQVGKDFYYKMGTGEVVVKPAGSTFDVNARYGSGSYWGVVDMNRRTADCR